MNMVKNNTGSTIFTTTPRMEIQQYKHTLIKNRQSEIGNTFGNST